MWISSLTHRTLSRPYSRAVPEAEPINVADYEALAAARLDPGVHGYFAGGAGDERTLRENVAAYARWRLRPRVLVDVSEVRTATRVLGTEISMPLMVAPVAFQRLVDPDGEVAMARAAAAAGTIMCLSTIATSRPSEIAAEAPAAPRWFQLYCFRDRGVTRALIDEAVESGFDAIILTVDAPRAGRRERDLRTGFTVPSGVNAPAVAAAVGSERAISIEEVFALVDPSLDWDEFSALASECRLPILVKGIRRRRGRAAGGRARRRRSGRLQPRGAPTRRRARDARDVARGRRGGRRSLRGADRRWCPQGN